MLRLLTILILVAGCQPELQPAACESNDGCTRAICVDGHCAAVQCAAPGECPSGTCELGRCVAIECRLASECLGGLICAAGLCVAPDGGYVAPPVLDAEVLDAQPVDAAPPRDMRPRDMGPPVLGLEGRYQLELTEEANDCEGLSGGQGNLRLRIMAGEPLTGVLEGATNQPMALQGEAGSLAFTLASTEPTLVDALVCEFALEVAFDGVRQPGGGIAGSLVWTLSEPEPCESVMFDCTRTDAFFGERIPE